MARGRRRSSKAEDKAARARQLDSGTFHNFITDISAAKQELDDANMAHAGAFKKADALGIHGQAAKLYLRLDKMETTKRTDFLRSFDQYREWAEHWTEQPDILDEDAAGEAAAAATKAETEGDIAREPPAADETSGVAAAAEADVAADKPEADWGDEQPTVEATADLDTAGFTFSAGRTAGLEGKQPTDNPHPMTSPSGPIWERGRMQGAKDKAEADAAAEHAETEDPAAEPEPEPEPTNAKRRSRAKHSENVAALH